VMKRVNTAARTKEGGADREHVLETRITQQIVGGGRQKRLARGPSPGYEDVGGTKEVKKM